MKAFWASVILFGVMLFFIGWNAIYIQDSAERIRAFAEEMKHLENRQIALLELDAFWEKHQNLIGLSVSFRETDHLSEMIDCLVWAQNVENEEEFQKYLILLLDAADEIERADRFSIGNLL